MLDAFAFLSECFTDGLRRACDRRNRLQELRSRDAEGPIVFEVKYRESKKSPLITYHLEIDEEDSGPIVSKEWLAWRRGKQRGGPYRFLSYQKGIGEVISGEEPEDEDKRVKVPLSRPDVLAVNALGQFGSHPRVSALRSFITGWYLSYFNASSASVSAEIGPQDRLSQNGDNLPNVFQYLYEQHRELLTSIITRLNLLVPRLEGVGAEITVDGRLVLKVKDAPFSDPVLAKFASDGTLKMLAYLIALMDPNPPKLIGIEEPENHLHPRLLRGLAEECQISSIISQILVSTHSPFFVDGLRPEEVWMLYRDEEGYTHARRASNMPRIQAFMEQGALLGNLWMEGHFDAGDPLTNAGDLTQRRSR